MTQFRRRTFGDLLDDQPGRSCLHLSCRCSFCKRDQWSDPNFKGARKYSERRYICDECIALKREEVLPSVKRHEALQARLAALRSPATSAPVLAQRKVRKYKVYQRQGAARRRKCIDIIYFAGTAEEVRNSLVNHDGYASDIEVVYVP